MPAPTPVLETDRLLLRRMWEGDEAFILELLNDESFVRFIGDRGVRTPEDARRYILEGPVASYQRFGFGLYVVEGRAEGAPVGICGLLKRDALEDVDIGYAFLPAHRSRGYALEAAAAVMEYGRDVLGLERIVAVTAPGNEASIRILERLGLRFDRMVRLPGQEESRLFVPAGETPPGA